MKLRRGINLIELLITITFMAMVLTGAAMMTISTGKSFQRSTTQLEVDQNASRGVQWISQDMQEAKMFEVKSSSWIRVYFPVQGVDGTYNRKITDTVNTLDYYRGHKNGTRDATGSYLIRAKVGQATRPVISDLIGLTFETDSPSSVNVDVQVRRTVNGKNYGCAMNHRAILMRNYQQ
jgi:Tfp pilus assembly protein PilW